MSVCAVSNKVFFLNELQRRPGLILPSIPVGRSDRPSPFRPLILDATPLQSAPFDKTLRHPFLADQPQKFSSGLYITYFEEGARAKKNAIFFNSF